jgi:hypothetical protein
MGLACGVAVVNGMTFMNLAATADGNNLYSINEAPYGIPYSNWTAKWWQWLTAIPPEESPANDETGKNCAVDQEGMVWFLAGTFGGSAERQCEIPQDSSILFAIIGGYCSFLTDPLAQSESELHDCARSGNNGATLRAAIDGVPIPDLQRFRITTEPFSLIIPVDNPFGSPPGTTTAVADGFYVFIKQLQPGSHIIQFSGSVVDNPVTGTQGFSTSVTYNLDVS